MFIVVTRNAKDEEVGRTYLKKDIEVTIGRAPDSTIFITVPAVSRRQGMLRVRNDQPFYFDDETSTGAKVNGEYVRGPTQLGPESVLEIADFKISVEVDPQAKRPKRSRKTEEPAPPQDAEEWIAAAAGGPVEDGFDMERMLAQRITGIRQYRDQNSEEAKARREQVETEWKQLVQSVHAFQAKLRGHARVQSFSVSRDETEVLAKLTDQYAPRGTCTLILARQHPDGKYPELEGAWLMELGKPETHYPSPKAAMEEFVLRLAPRLV